MPLTQSVSYAGVLFDVPPKTASVPYVGVLFDVPVKTAAQPMQAPITPGSTLTNVNQPSNRWFGSGTTSGALYDNFIWDRNASAKSNLMGWGANLGMMLIPGLGWAGLGARTAGKVGLMGARMANAARKAQAANQAFRPTLMNRAKTVYNAGQAGVGTVLNRGAHAFRALPKTQGVSGSLTRYGAATTPAASGLAAGTGQFLRRTGVDAAKSIAGYQAGLAAGAVAGTGANAVVGTNPNTVGEPTYWDRATDWRTIAMAPATSLAGRGMGTMVGRAGAGTLGRGIKNVGDLTHGSGSLLSAFGANNAGAAAQRLGFKGTELGNRLRASGKRISGWGDPYRGMTDGITGKWNKGLASGAIIGGSIGAETGAAFAANTLLPSDKGTRAVNELAQQYGLDTSDEQTMQNFREQITGSGVVKYNPLTWQYQGLRNHTDANGSPVVGIDLDGMKSNTGDMYYGSDRIDATDMLMNTGTMSGGRTDAVPQYRSFQDQFNRLSLEDQQAVKSVDPGAWQRYESGQLRDGEGVALGAEVRRPDGQSLTQTVIGQAQNGQVRQNPYYHISPASGQAGQAPVPGFVDPAYEQQRAVYNELQNGSQLVMTNTYTGDQYPVSESDLQNVRMTDQGFVLDTVIDGRPVQIPLSIK